MLLYVIYYFFLFVVLNYYLLAIRKVFFIHCMKIPLGSDKLFEC